MTEAPYAGRRQRLHSLMGADAALILAAAPELFVGRDTELRYAVDPDLYYLTGYSEPDAVLVLCPAHDEAPYTLFVRPRDAGREQWTGPRGGPEAAKDIYGADAAHPIDELAEKLPGIVSGVERLYARIGAGNPSLDARVLDLLARARRQRPRRGKGPLTVTDHGALLDELRLRKDPHEIELLREAVRVTVESYIEAAALIEPGAAEARIEATLEAGFRARGASGAAFPSIVAAGENATVLHYVRNVCMMRQGQLVLIDAGARRSMYCADISRTFPVGGRMSVEQRALYDGVLAARAAALAVVRPGATIRAVNRAALVTLLETLTDLGFVESTVADALEQEDTYKRFAPHRATHWLGLDVHDVGDYVVGGGSRVLEPGMVLTVEPGLYIPRDPGRGPAGLASTGIRIEDDVLVTPHGAEVLSAALPAGADEISALIGRGRA